MTIRIRIPMSFAMALFLSAATACFGASEKELLRKIDAIKNHPEYYWGEGQSADASKARERAKSDLAGQVQVLIQSSFDSWTEERGGHVSELVKENIRSFSSVALRGLREYVYKKGKEHVVFAYVDRRSVQEGFELRKSKIKELVRHGETLEQAGGIGPCLKNTYWAYLLSLTYPDSISYRFEGEARPTSDMPSALSNRMQSLLRSIVVTPNTVYRDGAVLMVPLRFSCHNQPIQALSFSYYSGSHTEHFKVPIEGSLEIPLYSIPSEAGFALTLTIEYQYESGMSQIPEVEQVYQFLSKSEGFNPFPENKKTVRIHPNSDEMPPPDPPPSDLPPTPAVIESLTACSNTQELLKQLNHYKRSGDLAVGKRSDFLSPEGCTVILVDKQQVFAYLQFVEGQFYDIGSKQLYSGTFSGKRQLWVRDLSALGDFNKQ